MRKFSIAIVMILAVSAFSGCTSKFASVPTIGMMSMPFAPLRNNVDYEIEQIKTGEQCGWILLPFLLKPLYMAIYGDPYDNLRVEALNQVIDTDSTVMLPLSFAVESKDFFFVETYCGKVQAAAVKFIGQKKKK